MAPLAAGQPFYESTWLAAVSVVLFVIILSTILILLVRVAVPTIRRIWRIIVTGPMVSRIRRIPKSLRWVIAGAAFLFVITFVILYQGNSGPPPASINNAGQLPTQVALQQHLSADEQALDKGILTYAPLPALKADLPVVLTVTVTDLGKHPSSFLTAQEYSQATGMVVYPGDVPTGGIVGLRLTCTANVYCQELSSTRQAVVGLMASQTWSWDLTALQPGPTSVVITAATYDGTTDIVLNEEIIPVRLTVETGPWWAAVYSFWHTMTSFALTTAGLITAIGGAGAVIAGCIGWARRRRTRTAQTQSGPKASNADEANGIHEPPPNSGRS
jgi:hypothetical protein